MKSFFGSDSEEDDDEEVQVLSYIDTLKARQAEKERKRKEAKELDSSKTPEAKSETQQKEYDEALLSERFVRKFETKAMLSTPVNEDIEEDTKPPFLEDLTDDPETKSIKEESDPQEENVDTPSYASVVTSTPYYSVDSKGSISNEVLLKATKEEIEVLKKYGVITEVTDVISSPWKTPMKSEFTFQEDTPSKRKSNQITDKSELTQTSNEPNDDAEVTTKESDTTPESSEETTEDGFKPVSNKKGRRRSMDELANLKTSMNFSSKGNRKTRNSQRFAVLEDSTHVEKDSDFHKAESD
jgi:hypothetical protein